MASGVQKQLHHNCWHLEENRVTVKLFIRQQKNTLPSGRPPSPLEGRQAGRHVAILTKAIRGHKQGAGD